MCVVAECDRRSRQPDDVYGLSLRVHDERTIEGVSSRMSRIRGGTCLRVPSSISAQDEYRRLSCCQACIAVADSAQSTRRVKNTRSNQNAFNGIVDRIRTVRSEKR